MRLEPLLTQKSERLEKLEVLGNLNLVMYEIMGDWTASEINLETLLASVRDSLEDMGEAERFEAHIIKGDDPGEIVLQIRDRPAIDRLADVSDE